MNTRSFISSVFAFILGGLGLTLLGYHLIPSTTGGLLITSSILMIILTFSYSFFGIKGKFLISGLVSLFIGSMLYPVMQFVNSDTIGEAIGLTMIVTGTMAFLGFSYPKIFKELGPVLFVSLLFLIGYGLLGSLFGFIDMTLYSWIATGIFTLYIGYDVYKALESDRTIESALDSAFSLYLNIVNLFLNILRILGNED